MKRIMMPLAATGAVALLAACGNTPAPGTDAAGASGPSVVAATTLSQADLGPKVQAALAKKGTFRVVSKTTGEDPGTLTADVKLGGATPEFVVNADGTTVMGVGGRLYGQGEGISDGAQWVKYDAKKKGLDALSGVVIQLIAWQAQPQQFLGATPYATKFTSAPGPDVDGVHTTLYDVTIDLEKAAQAKAFGNFITAESLAQEKTKTLSAKVLLDGDSLPRKIDYTFGAEGGSSVFSKFGDSVIIAAPPIDQVAK
ncbi:hypothetical protein F1D05_37115 [Kribbella qitaiheensis]|uniref:LppX_LprAFG lipoprotein n=1 Tax=Kribbella qitaiheensis TaxID=1544730 RepID=A0A7G6X8D4_9ACTN|nr:hypothetical protein [Kribbella qitaiheensis]QNE22499.1 hypothetical protein F1D05_37115 [Kribbella qitaiheensis]